MIGEETGVAHLNQIGVLGHFCVWFGKCSSLVFVQRWLWVSGLVSISLGHGHKAALSDAGVPCTGGVTCHI